MSTAVTTQLIVLRCQWCGMILLEVSSIPAVLRIRCPNRECKMIFETGERS